ncbi:MAG: hypothetical protein ACJAXS_002445 [Colwellia sp.]|jgi:hypothetical protein
MNTSILTRLLLLTSFAFNTAIASVTVTINQDQYVFAHEPRLVEILAPIANQANWYWPSAALYRVDDIKLEEKRKLLINSISNLVQRYQTEEPKIAKSLAQLQANIDNWQLAKRLPVKIDYDLARMINAANPQLPKGKYILSLTQRINTVQLFGAVKKTGEIPHLPHTNVSEYIVNHTLTGFANKDMVMLIQADGRLIESPAAYWNKTHQEVMPGSQLFVPFKQSLFKPEFANINRQILTLALNRVR